MVIQFINGLLAFVVIGLFLLIPIWIWGMYDAYKTAEKNNTGQF